MTKATESKEETRGGAVEEQVKLWKLEKVSNKYNNADSIETATEIVNRLVNENLLTEAEKDKIIGNEIKGIEATGQIVIGSKAIVFFEIPSVLDYLKIGDYIDYNPTKTDANKTQNVDSNKLTYTSPTGTATEHGNGYTSSETGGGQKFTAKSTLKWRILNITNDTIEIIPSEVIKKDEQDQNNGNFVISGARGYLYAEQELNEICKIYGYGYGADLSVGSTFKIGGPSSGEETTRRISDTGARSISVDDINKIANISESSNDVTRTFKYLIVSYGETSRPTSNIFYPTIDINKGNNTTGNSKTSGVKKLKDTYYNYNKSQISNTDIQDILFNNKYWTSSRCISTFSDTASFCVFRVGYDQVNTSTLLMCYTNRISTKTESDFGVLPIVSLKSNVIDLSNPTTTCGRENNPWSLK